MKYFLTCLALGIAFAAGAQTGLVEFPYNPDADNDDVIGVNDLLELLSLYGSEFAEESLYLNDSNTTAIYHIQGQWYYGMCEAKCRELPSGKWRMIDYETWAEFHNEVELMCSNGFPIAWLRTTPIDPPDNDSNRLPAVFGESLDKGRLTFGGTFSEFTCACETQERPKVEYSYCMAIESMLTVPYDDAYVDDFEACCDSKLQDGWYPLGGLTKGWSNDGGQAFWRWAE